MKQGVFERRYQPVWQEFEALLAQLELDEKHSGPIGSRKARPPSQTSANMEEFTSLYRKLCHLNALAIRRNYSSYLVDKLGDLIVRGHQQLYQRKPRFGRQILRFLMVDFPQLVRAEAKLFWLSSALFYGPGLLIFIAILLKPDLIYTMMSPDQVSNFEAMYDPSNRTLGAARESETNWQMFGFYIYNNISVAFQTFATGILFCVGSLFYLIFNGLNIGAVAAHLTNVEFTETFFTFVVGHGSFELTAIVIAGAAGLKLGIALLSPGSLPRVESLRRAAQVSIKLVYGVTFLLLIAAFVEAFWSSNNILAPWQKYLFGGVFWLVVAAYLVLSGRGYAPAKEAA